MIALILKLIALETAKLLLKPFISLGEKMKQKNKKMTPKKNKKDKPEYKGDMPDMAKQVNNPRLKFVGLW